MFSPSCPPLPVPPCSSLFAHFSLGADPDLLCLQEGKLRYPSHGATPRPGWISFRRPPVQAVRACSAHHHRTVSGMGLRCGLSGRSGSGRQHADQLSTDPWRPGCGSGSLTALRTFGSDVVPGLCRLGFSMYWGVFVAAPQPSESWGTLFLSDVSIWVT